MLTKIFIGVLALSVLATGFFAFYSWSWLGSIGAPAPAVAGYEYHASISWNLLWISALILLVLGNSILWAKGSLWPLWTALIYFLAFVIVRAFWLDAALLTFKNNAGMTDATFTIRPIMAALLIIISAAIVFFDQYLVMRLKEKTYPKSDPESPRTDDGIETADDDS